MEADSCNSLDKQLTNFKYDLIVALIELGDGLDVGRQKKGAVK